MNLFLLIFFLNCFALCITKLYEDVSSRYKRHRHWHGHRHGYCYGGFGPCPYPYWGGPGGWNPYAFANATYGPIMSCINNNCPDGYTCFRNQCYMNEIFQRAIDRYNSFFYRNG
uniref:Uncharacterized protein n=1 Tax=Strongyloides papillosus TaxID=174720 RepID=A0A0N5CIW1_STREA